MKRAFDQRLAQIIVLMMMAVFSLPQGMMLARNGATDRIEITICSGAGSRAVWLDPATGSLVDPEGTLGSEPTPDAPDRHASSDLCPFSVTADADLPHANNLVAQAPSPPRLHVATHDGHHRRPSLSPPPRGPPAAA